MSKNKYRIGPDIDLDDEVVLLANGERLTEAMAEEIAEEALSHHRSRGRPSLSGRPETTPQIAARVPAEVRERLEARATAEGKKLSQVVREALEAYVA